MLALTVILVLALSASAAAKTLTTYTRTGGFIGEQTSLTVSTGGATKRDSARLGTNAFTMSKKKLKGLKRALKDARFTTLKARYAPPESTVADGIVETVRYKGRTVTAETGGKVPDRLQKVLDRLSALAAKMP